MDTFPTIKDVSFTPKLNYTPHCVLVLGNGFDLSLGMKTKYSDFASNDKFWPFKDSMFSHDDHSLPHFLNEHKNVDSWFDLEELIARYASDETICNSLEDYQVKQNIDYFQVLGSKLCEYLQHEEDEYVKRMSERHGARPATPVHSLLNTIMQKESFSVYTFNYTNVWRIINQFILSPKGTFDYVHGSIRNNDIVLGAGDGHELNDRFFQFHKSVNKNYKSSNLVEDLSNADEVYFFGHSLGKNDHDYFKEFFMGAMQGKRRMMAPSKLKIRIFTKDYNSEVAICKQLMALTDKHLTGLRAHCDFKFIKTDEATLDELLS